MIDVSFNKRMFPDFQKKLQMLFPYTEKVQN